MTVGCMSTMLYVNYVFAQVIKKKKKTMSLLKLKGRFEKLKIKNIRSIYCLVVTLDVMNASLERMGMQITWVDLKHSVNGDFIYNYHSFSTLLGEVPWYHD